MKGRAIRMKVDMRAYPQVDLVEGLASAALAHADTHWGCMTCSAGTSHPVTNRQAEVAAANHASQGGHPTVYARVKP